MSCDGVMWIVRTVESNEKSVDSIEPSVFNFIKLLIGVPLYDSISPPTYTFPNLSSSIDSTLAGEKPLP